jgi:hypothetical protein
MKKLRFAISSDGPIATPQCGNSEKSPSDFDDWAGATVVKPESFARSATLDQL